MATTLFNPNPNPLVIHIADDHLRLIAEIFPHPQGILFFDIGWSVNVSGHSIHLVEGDVRETTTHGHTEWLIGNKRIRQLRGKYGEPERPDPDDPFVERLDDTSLWYQWTDWQQCLKAYPPTRERILELARDEGALA